MEGSIELNKTEDLMIYHFNYLHLTVYLIFTIPLWCINVVGNVLVLLCVYREKQLRRPSYYLIVALSLADIAFPLFGYVPLTYRTFIRTYRTCDPAIQFYLLIPTITAAFASFQTLLTLTSERYLSIAFPVYHRRTVTTRRVLALVVFHWILSALTSCVSAYPFKPPTLRRLYCVPFQMSYLVITLPFGIIGLLLLSSLNAHLLFLIRRRLRKEAERKATSQKDDAQIRRGSMNAKASKAVTIVVIFFVICWLPAILLLLLEAVNYKMAVNLTLS